MRRILPAAAVMAAAVAVTAQQPQTLYPAPRVHSVFPMGGRVDSAVDVTVLGTDLDDPARLVFSHPGLTAEIPPPPPEPPADPKKKDPPKEMNKKKAPPPTTATFRVKVAANVPPGTYDVRLAGKWGVSNPRAFVVGDRPEVGEKEPNNDADETAQKVPLEVVVNGVINGSTDVDYFAVAGMKGQRLLAHCATGGIDSRARPLVEIYGGSDGRTRLGGNRNYDGTDALADVTLPADGTYFVRVVEFAHQQGGPDYFYRLTLTAGPWVDAAFPMVIAPGKATTVTLTGRNLPGGKPSGTTIDGRPVETLTADITPPKPTAVGRGVVPPPMAFADPFDYRLKGANPIPLFVANHPVILESDKPNDTAATAQTLNIPCEVVGRIDRALDRDWYNFAAKKGDVRVLDLAAERLGTSLDGFLVVRDAAGKDIANDTQLDDDPDTLHPQQFYTRTADPPNYRFVAPADGVYTVLVGSRVASVSYGPRVGYRLRIGAPTPAFRAVVMAKSRELPQAAVVLPEGHAALDVFVQRLDGFAGPLTVTATGLPDGVTAKPVVVGSTQRWGTVLLSGAAKLADAEAVIGVLVTGTVDGKPVSIPALPASISWGVPGQQNVPTLTRLDQTLMIATRSAGKPAFKISADTATATVKHADGKEEKLTAPFVVKSGDRLTIPVSVKWEDAEPRANPIQVSLEPAGPQQPQQGISANNNQPIPIPKDKPSASLVVDVRNNAAPGVYTATVRGDVQTKFARDGKDKKDVTLSAYAVPFEVLVLPTTLGKLSAKVASVKVGQSAEFVVSVERQFEFAGEFNVSLTFPKESGLSAKDVVIVAGGIEAKVIVEIGKDVKPGNVNVGVVAVAKYEGKHAVSQEAKTTLTINK